MRTIPPRRSFTAHLCLLVVVCALGGCEGELESTGSDDDAASQSMEDASSGTDDVDPTPDTDDDPPGDATTDSHQSSDGTSDGDSESSHLCPAGTSCVVYSRLDADLDNTLWFVDPAAPGARIDISAQSDADGALFETKADPTGRYVLFEQKYSSGGVGFYLADLTEPNAPKVEKVFDGDPQEFGFGPEGEYMFAVTGPVRDRVRIAPTEPPFEWNLVSEAPAGDDANLRSWLQPRNSPISPDGSWAFFETTHLPDRDNDEDEIFDAIARAPIDAGTGSLSYLVTTRDTGVDSFEDWVYVPSTDILIVEATTELFWMPAEPGGSPTRIAPMSLDSQPYRRFDRASIGPDGNPIALSMLNQNAHASVDDGDVTLRFVDPTEPDRSLDSVTLNYGHVSAAKWNGDGTELVVSVEPTALSNQGTPKVWHIDTQSYRATEVTGTIPAASYLEDQQFGPDGDYYFSVVGESQDHSYGGHLYRADLPDGTAERIDRRSLSGTNSFAFSADGSYIFYEGQADYESTYNLYRAPVDDPANATLISQKAMEKDVRVGSFHVVGAK